MIARRLGKNAAMVKICWMMGVLLASIPMVAYVKVSAIQNLEQIRADLRTTVTFRDKFYDAAAVGNQVWLVGYYGTILHFDGDASRFQRQASRTNLPLFDVSFLDEKTGYIVGKRGIVLKTSDGGQNWTMVKAAGEKNLFSAHFIDHKTGWAVGDFGTIVHTSDGGKTWVDRSLADADINFNCCYFFNAQKGIVVGEFEGIYLTEDGGSSWREINEQNYSGVSLFSVAFKTADKGLAVAQNGVTFQTTDGGMTWQRHQMKTTDNLLNVGVVDGTYNIVGLRGVMLSESPDGEFLMNRNLSITDWLHCIVELKNGWAIAAGDHGRIILSMGSQSRRAWQIVN